MLNKLKTVIRKSRLYNKLVFIKNLRGKLFDLKHNVDTASEVELGDLRIDSENVKYGAKYMGSDPKAITELFGSFKIKHEDFVFVDLGSGKGRVLFVASTHPYKKIIGVEFAEDLHEIAQKNIKNYRSKDQKCKDIESICIDAAKFKIPDEPLVFYLFNPFSEKVISEVLKNIEISLEKHPREIYIFYLAFFHRQIFDESIFFETIESSDWHILYKSSDPQIEDSQA
jgi:SAM-dependent methyltransferase